MLNLRRDGVMRQFMSNRAFQACVGLLAAVVAAFFGYRLLHHESVVPPVQDQTVSGKVEVSSPDPFALVPDEVAKEIEKDLGQLLHVEGAANALVNLRQRIVELNREEKPYVHAVIAITIDGIAKRFGSLDDKTKQACFYIMSEGVAWAAENPCPTWPKLLPASEKMLREHLATAVVENRVQGLNFVRVSWEWLPYGVKLNEAQSTYIGRWKAALHDCATELLHAPNEEVREAAVRAVAAAPVDDAAKDALVGLEDPSPRVRRATVLVLADRPAVLPTEKLLPLLNDSNYDVRTTVRIALQSRGVSQPEISIAAMVFSPLTLARQQAARHIAMSSFLDRVAWLRLLARDEEPDVRAEAAKALAYVGTPAAVKELRRLAGADPQEEVRRLAKQLVAETNSSPTGRLKQASHQR